MPGVDRAWRTISTSPFAAAAHDDQLVAHHPAPHLGALVAVGGGVAHRAEADGLVIADQPGLAQGGGVGLSGQDVEVGGLLGQHVGRRPAGLAVPPAVDLLAERVAGDHQGGESGVGVEQVRLGGDDVALGHLHRRLRAPFGLGVIRDTRL
ncbi:MAG: hypothetical protein ACRD0H_15690, partial [Actinomycetes bacterium]